MSLAVDVHASLDLTGPVGTAKATLLAHLDTDDVLRRLLSGNAATVVTGDLGAGLADLGSGLLASPETLLGPLEAALRGLAGQLDLGPLGRLGDLLDTIESIGGIAERLVALTAPGISPLDLGLRCGRWRLRGHRLAAGLDHRRVVRRLINLVLDSVDLPNRLAPVADVRAAVAAVDGFVATGDAGALLEGLAPLLLPLPLAPLRELRGHLDLLDTRIGRVPETAGCWPRSTRGRSRSTPSRHSRCPPPQRSRS